ncbi:MAG: hypothetical protein CVV06_05930 [Gammaproteobacteria bacterium HGW-Gammaproteobacteria-10]|nr:MAG: hypothetical protein CVV06_05930 [Gammaproteobacteria bacterium HGW-Gammaproteobacteria-10]
MSEQESNGGSGYIEQEEKSMHPLIKLGILSVGSKVGAEIILKLAKHPVLLMAMGIGSGLYINKHRKDILEAAQQLKDQGLAIVKKKD